MSCSHKRLDVLWVFTSFSERRENQELSEPLLDGALKESGIVCDEMNAALM